jgi:hypothetical protein
MKEIKTECGQAFLEACRKAHEENGGEPSNVFGSGVHKAVQVLARDMGQQFIRSFNLTYRPQKGATDDRP